MSTEHSSFIKIRAVKNSLSTDESVYLYLKGELKGSARADFETRLEKDSILRNRVDASRDVLDYSSRLAQVQVTEELKQKVLDSTTYWAALAKKLNRKNWPREFSLFAESLALGLLVFFVLQAMPWSSLQKWWTVGVDSIRIEREKKNDLVASAPELKSTPSPVTKDPTPKALTPTPVANQDLVPTTPVVTPSPVSKAVAQNSPVVEKPIVEPKAASTAVAQKSSQALGSSVKEGQRKGYVYRLFMDLSRLDQLTQPIAQKIKGLGGEKAGDVPLGWKRGEGSYYHFTLPETNYANLLAQLKSYGPVRISKDAHPRVMPEGTIRLILWIESLDGKGRSRSGVNKSGDSGENVNSDPSAGDSEDAESGSGQ